MRPDRSRGLDHAAWAVLKHMYPDAGIPVLEVSLDSNKTPEEHYELGKALAPLRGEGVLIIGSGNIVHNLSQLDFANMYGPVYPWAAEFDAQVEQALIRKDHESLIHYEKISQAGRAVPTSEHYLPMLYVLASREEDDRLQFVCNDIQNASISMRSFLLGS